MRTLFLLGAAVVAIAVPGAARSQNTPGDLLDMVGAQADRADNALPTRGYRLVRSNPGGGTWNVWWNQRLQQCVTILVDRNKYRSINLARREDCRGGGGPGGPGPGGPGWGGGGPGGPRPGGPGWGNGGGGVPRFNARCPTGIRVRADQGGPIWINGDRARMTVNRPGYYEARSGKITVSVTRGARGEVSVSYTGPRRANGMCQVFGY